MILKNFSSLQKIGLRLYMNESRIHDASIVKCFHNSKQASYFAFIKHFDYLLNAKSISFMHIYEKV